ncbi:uncharacterized protein LOC122571611 isoform X3 [Bombus pyrosoma]|uniref:uncharacterized protein LOC122571611 isoform X3 n=1 Tax=Bombus pyrosoma TaxID=396416 RepID=UPI001CB996CC|nr:uncharacterized protein LOC122571611 isoform X3 [Bombus pyrosoma]
MVKICISEYEVPERGFDVSRCPVVRASHTPLHRYNLSLWTIEATISNMNVIRRYKVEGCLMKTLPEKLVF